MTTREQGSGRRDEFKAFIGATWRYFALIVVGIAPFLVLATIVGWHNVITIAIYGFFVVLLATIPNGVRTGLVFAFVFAAFATAGALAQHSVIATTVVVGLSAALIPFFRTRGRLQAGIFTAMFVPITCNPPPQPWPGTDSYSATFLAAVAAVALAGGLWGLLIGQSVRRRLPAVPAAPRLPIRAAVVGGALLVTVACTVTYVSVTQFPQAKWSWLLAALYSMMMATTGMTLKSSRDMIVGTSVGVVGAVLILFVGLPTSAAILVGSIILPASLALRAAGKSMWISTGVSTSGVILLTGASMDPYVAAQDRLVFSAVGAIIAVLLGSAITWAVRWQSRERRRGHVAATP